MHAYIRILVFAYHEQSEEVAGLLKIQDGGRTFYAIKQNLQLYNQELDKKNPTDIVYYNGW